MDLRKLQPLLPPFLQGTNSRKYFSSDESSSRITHELHDRDVPQVPLPGLLPQQQINSLGSQSEIILSANEVSDFITPCTNTERVVLEDNTFNLAEKRAEVAATYSGDYCTSSNLQCENLHDEASAAASEAQSNEESHGDPYNHSDLPDFYYQNEQEEEGSNRDEASDYESFSAEGRESLWPLKRCECIPPGTGNELLDLENMTAPYLCHKLVIPYDRIPEPRYFKNGSINVEYVLTALPKRPSLSISEITPCGIRSKNRFNEWGRSGGLIGVERFLTESKNRITQTVQTLLTKQVDMYSIIISIILQALCEQISLTIDMEIEVDIDTFVDAAVLQALNHLERTDDNAMSEKREWFEREMVHESAEYKKEESESGLRKTLLAAYRPAFSRDFYVTFHRRLPWSFVAPSHQREHVKFYANVRERIDEKLLYGNTDYKSVYVPDLTCFHLRDISRKPHVAYKRRSRIQSTLQMSQTLDITVVSLQKINFV